MDARAAKLALARKKLKDHQERKQQDNIVYIDQTKSLIAEQSPICSQGHDEPSHNEAPITMFQELCLDESSCKNFKLQHDDAGINNNITETGINATEILISSKIILEQQVNSLQIKLLDLENELNSTTKKYENSCQRITNLEIELTNSLHESKATTELLKFKDTTIKELNDSNLILLNEKTNLQEQLEFTKSILATKEADNVCMHNKLINIESELDSTRLQLQQLTNGAQTHHALDNVNSLKNENEVLMQKVSHLEQQLKIQIKDYQQLNNHYEHYVGELNDQLKEVMKKNEQMSKEIQDLSNRENGLVEQISDMEIRLQNYKKAEPIKYEQLDVTNSPIFKELQETYDRAQKNLLDLNKKYDDLQKLYSDSRSEIENLMHSKQNDTHEATDNVSLIKLNADITSDKIAAQRATEQNKKLKEDIHGLEDAFVKMTKDKLELTEKITAEKFLNRELTIKLAEVDEKANDMSKKLKAKDEEMMRLQASYRVVEEKYNEIAHHLKHLNGKPESDEISHSDQAGDEKDEEMNTTAGGSDLHMLTTEAECEHTHKNTLEECKTKIHKVNSSIPKDDAMVKLQERFLKIMDEVADLSDEKHRLEHIITQLQNETDTICEYVALYQEQRSLLNKRDEERSAQMKMFQSECYRLQSQLDELTGILKRFAEDSQLAAYFQVQTKHEDIQKVMKLLNKLKTNSLIDPHKSMKFNDFYPCSCCSGQLIEV